MIRPTAKMINYSRLLIEKCGYDKNDYSFADMSFEECSLLIDQLKDDLSGKPGNEER